MLVGPADIVAAMLQQRGQRGHGRSTNADQMYACHYETAASMIMTDGDALPTTSARTPNGKVQVAPAV